MELLLQVFDLVLQYLSYRQRTECKITLLLLPFVFANHHARLLRSAS
jgi:hypothetical protein